MKAALLIAGHLRSWRSSKESLYHLWRTFRDYKLDVFVSVWMQSDTSDGPTTVEKKSVDIKEISTKDICSFYRPKKIKVNDYDLWRPKFHYKNFLDVKPEKDPAKYYIINDILIAAPQSFNIWQACQLVDDEYDVIIRARPDFLPTQAFELYGADRIVFPFVHKGGTGVFAVDDRFFYGPTKEMKIFCQIWPNMNHLIRDYDENKFPYAENDCKCQHLSLEKIMHRWLVENNLEFETNPEIELKRV